MKPYALTYPVTQEVLDARSNRPNLAKAPQLRSLTLGQRSPHEIVRLLGNLHYDHIRKLVDRLEHLYIPAGEIRKKVLQQTNPFSLGGALAEFEAFSYLYARPGPVVKAVPTGAAVGHDITVPWNDLEIRIEVFSPADVVGYQRFARSIMPAFKYADVPRGFEVSLVVNSADSMHPFQFPDEQKVYEWFDGFCQGVKTWLSTAIEGASKKWDGPEGLVEITATLDRIHDDPGNRSVSEIGATRSSDSAVFFERNTGSQIAAARWGSKMGAKLGKQQCGPADQTALRVLLVDFSGLDASERDFICASTCAKNINKAICIKAAELALPYDVVLPAHLGQVVGFGPAVVLDESRSEEIEGMIRDLDLERAVPPYEKGDPFDSLIPAQLEVS